MTNAEKFKEVFGFKPAKTCIIPKEYCLIQNSCKDCAYYHWQDKEYIEKENRNETDN